MYPLETAELGSTGVRATRLGFGGAPIGGLFFDVEEDGALAAIRAGLDLGLCYFDTAPLYGHGRSEMRYAKVLSEVPRDDFILSTKVGRVLNPVDKAPHDAYYMSLPPLNPVFDYSRDGILRSLEESLRRLNLQRVDIIYIHDPDDHWEEAIGQAYPAVEELRSQGVVRAIGVGMNQWEMLARFAEEGSFDCFLLAGRYTLLDQSSLPEFLPLCEEKGISVVIGGPYNSGILASDLGSTATYDYERAPPEILDKARKIKAACDRYDVPLKAVALQIVLAHPAVATVIPGARSVSEVEQNLMMIEQDIPPGLWADLREEGLIDKAAPVPNS